MNYDVKVSNIYINNKEVDSFPKKSSGYKFDKIECTNDVSATFNEESWSVELGDLNSQTECSIYFNKVHNNPDTGTFINIGLIIIVIVGVVYALYRIKNKNKFFRI